MRLSASEISGLLAYPIRIGAFNPPAFEEAVRKGRMVHMRLGFTSTQTYQRYFKVGKEMVLIAGMSDRVEPECVFELKTFHNEGAKKKNLEVGRIQTQVYCFITGLSKGKVVMFDLKQDKISCEEEVIFDKAGFGRIIKKAVKLKKMIEAFKEDFKKAQKGDEK